MRVHRLHVNHLPSQAYLSTYPFRGVQAKGFFGDPFFPEGHPQRVGGPSGFLRNLLGPGFGIDEWKGKKGDRMSAEISDQVVHPF